MILDITNQIATAYAPTAIGTQVNGTYIDTLTIEDWGMGEALHWLTSINTTVTGNATATLNFILQGAIDSVFTSPVTVAQALPTPILQANFATQAVKGTQYAIKFPRGFAYRYYRLGVVIGTATLIGGAFDSWILNDAIQDNKSYPSGYLVK